MGAYNAPMPILLSDTERAHLAGYFDAEGYIGVAANRLGRWGVQAKVKQTNPAVIGQFLVPAYGGKPFIERPKKGRPKLVWQLQAINEVRRFLGDLLPYLREKRPQVEVLLERFDSSDSEALSVDLKHMKHVSSTFVVDEGRRAIAKADPDRKCLMCEEKAHARGLCKRHYAKAYSEGKIKARKKTEGIVFERGRELSDIDKAYFAGYFDGDGCVLISTYSHGWMIRVVFCQTCDDVLQDFHLTYGGSLRPEKPNLKWNQSPALRWQLTQRKATDAFLRDVAPYCVEKRDQVEALLSRFDPKMDHEKALALKADLSQMKRATIAVDPPGSLC